MVARSGPGTYTVRLYRPRPEILNGKWKFPVPQPTSLLRAAKWENEFYAAGIAPKDNCWPGENLMLCFGRSLPANN